jgi:hypothetical protein
MEACFNTHRDVALPSERIWANLTISAAGKATKGEITPEALNASTLGQCVRNVLGSAKFPTAPNDNSIRFPLSAK